MAYRSRLQRIQEKRNLTKAIAMFGVGMGIIALLIMYGVKGMASLAILIDKIKFGNKGIDITDNIPPAPPTIWTEYTATNSATIKIYALSEPASVVNLMRGEDKIIDMKANDEGKLEFDNVILVNGINEFWAIASDATGNNSHGSRRLVIEFADKVPELTLERPSEDQKFSGKDNPIEIKGKTRAQAKVFINGRLTLADSNGDFLMKFTLSEGENVLKFRILDLAGNEMSKEVKVSYQP